MNTATRQRLALGTVITLMATAILGALFLFARVAHAATDPVTTATVAAASGWDVVAHQGPLLGALLLAYGVVRQILKANESAHWIAQGKTLSITTAIMMIIGTALDWKFNGGQPAEIITALFAAIPLIMHSTVNAKPAAAPPIAPAAATTAALMLLGLLAGGVLAAACTHEARVGALKTGGKIAWDCTAPERAEAVTALTPLAISAIQAAASYDGKLIDASKVRAAFSTANLKSDAGALLVCAASSGFAALLAAATAPKPATGTASAELELDPAALKAALEVLRAAQFPGVQVKTSAGVM